MQTEIRIFKRNQSDCENINEQNKKINKKIIAKQKTTRKNCSCGRARSFNTNVNVAAIKKNRVEHIKSTKIAFSHKVQKTQTNYILVSKLTDANESEIGFNKWKNEKLLGSTKFIGKKDF